MVELAAVLLLLLVGFVFGQLAERRHLRQLDQREQALARFPVIDIARLPGLEAATGALVHGEVVIATDYFKTFLASLRSIVGGEVGSFRKLLDRARREARLRMLEEARTLGATAVVNVRFTMNDIGGGRSVNTEILCYGTALVPAGAAPTAAVAWTSDAG